LASRNKAGEGLLATNPYEERAGRVSRPEGEKSERRIEPVFLAGENGCGLEPIAPSLVDRRTRFR